MPDLTHAAAIDPTELRNLLSLIAAKVISETEVREYLQIDTKEPIHA